MRNDKSRKGNAIIELMFVVCFFLAPLFLGVTAIGIHLLSTLEALQVARDTGHMAAKGIDFTIPANEAILRELGKPIGLTDDPATSGGVLILSVLTYVDTDDCEKGGLAPAECSNLGFWVYSQQLTYPNGSTLQESGFGVPPRSITNPTTGEILAADYLRNVGARVDPDFDAINPFRDGVRIFPQAQNIFLTEAAAKPFGARPGVEPFNVYSYCVF